jgi:hypothetical protein
METMVNNTYYYPRAIESNEIDPKVYRIRVTATESFERVQNVVQ